MPDFLNDFGAALPQTRKPATEAPVAVIAIHGVGKHLSGASADAIATLLMNAGRKDKSRHLRDWTSERQKTKEEKEAQSKHGGLLTEPGPPPLYDGFSQQLIDVPLLPVSSPMEEDANRVKDFAAAKNRSRIRKLLSEIWGMFDERRDFLSERRKTAGYDSPLVEERRGHAHKSLAPHTGEEELDRDEFSYQYMYSQLNQYDGEVGRDFSTFRFEGERREGGKAKPVHIYDAHYSDLSKPENGVVGFFFALYQLLFHLASLSLQTVYWAEAENAKKQEHVYRWRVLSSVHAMSIRLLVMWVPLLNLTLLAVGLGAFADKVNESGARMAGFGLAALLGIAAVFFWRKERKTPSTPFFWAGVPVAGAIGGMLILGGLACLLQCLYQFYGTSTLGVGKILLLLSGLAILGGAIFRLASKFQSMRPGSFGLSIALYAVNMAIFFGWYLPKAAHLAIVGAAGAEAATASFWSVQMIFGQLSWCWAACLLSAFASWPLGALCILGIKSIDQRAQERKSRAQSAMRTGRLAFALPALLFLLVTLALWIGIVVYGSNKLGMFDKVSHEAAALGPSQSHGDYHPYVIPDICYMEAWVRHGTEPLGDKVTPFAEAVGGCRVTGSAGSSAPGGYELVEDVVRGAPKECLRECAQARLKEKEPVWDAYLRGLLLRSVTSGLPLTLLLMAAGLLMLTWAALPSVLHEIKPEGTTVSDNSRTKWLGEWLSRGLDSTAIVTRLLWIAIVPVPIIFAVLDLVVWNGRGGEPLHEFLIRSSRLTLPILMKTGLLIGVFGTAIFALGLKYLSPILDTILDIDNYLRTSPANLTPRARIAERYSSLLRYLGAYRDEYGRPYERVIVVAHSLGTMVTADLFRYLHHVAKVNPTLNLGLDGFGFGAVHGETADGKTEPASPLYLMSMGSPLRQLLNRFFPHLYWYMKDTPDNSPGHQLAQSPVMPQPDISSSELPCPDDLCVRGWLNAYRSGDYVGRFLWVKPWLSRNGGNFIKEPVLVRDVPTTVNDQTRHTRAEMCIGIGAHTHYWDRTGDDVGAKLDILINDPRQIF